MLYYNTSKYISEISEEFTFLYNHSQHFSHNRFTSSFHMKFKKIKMTFGKIITRLIPSTVRFIRSSYEDGIFRSAIFCDFSKAFDSISQMKNFQNTRKNSYWSSRSQRVYLNYNGSDIISDKINIEHDVA